MVSPPLEGLNALLEKNPIIPTFKARDLYHLPEDVEAAYERHVRTYVPLSRGVGDDEGVDMTAFVQKLLRLVRDAKAPIGYVAAEYGHGKTSTGLFLWDQARSRNVLAVPPFSLDRLEDLITAVAGWVRLMVERVRPSLGEEVETVYKASRTEGVEALAQQHAKEFGRPYEEVLTEFRRLDAQDKLQTNADGLTYVNFLEAVAAIAARAGFEGLLVVADEVQQYIEHADVSSAVEPLGRLFDLITTMLSRTGRLACGLVLLLPNKELGLLNQQRGDLVQRMKASRLALDLTQLYTSAFAVDLWERLADTFRFTDLCDRVITEDALLALGEIAARTDLASGPRTVVDVFKIACERFRAGAETPYGLLDLVHSFEEGEVAFDGLSRIQGAVRQALAHELVRGKPDMEKAVRLMAAFPTTGLSEPLQVGEGVRDAVDDLQRLAGGELVAIRGGGYDHTGRVLEVGVTLIALRPAQEQVTWLKGTIRDFRRNYFLGSEQVHRLAAQAFRSLITSRLFPAPHWRVEREFEATAISQNQGLLLRGAFPSAARRFPDRMVYLRILQPQETPRDVLAPHDLLIDVALCVPRDVDGSAEWPHTGVLAWLAPNHARLDLNLLHRETDATYLDLNPGFEDIVAPYDVNPLLTLSLHAHLARILATGGVPGAEESNVRDLFLPALHSAALRDVCHAALGRTAEPPVPAADARFFEVLVQLLCERTYSDGYVTLMVTGQWQKALTEYRGALQRIDNPYIQNGNEPFEGMKKDVADLLNRTNATLDNFITSFPHLITVESPFRGDTPGRVRFTLHPLEQRIIQLVQAGEKLQRLHPRTGRAVVVPTVPVAEVNRVLAQAGYRMGEVEVGLELLEARRMIEWDQRTGTVALTEPDIPSLDIVQGAVRALAERFTTVRPVLSNATVRILDTTIAGLQRAVQSTERPLRGNELLRVKRTVDQAVAELDRDRGQQRLVFLQQATVLTGTNLAEGDQSDTLAELLDDGLFAGQLSAVRQRLMEEMGVAAEQAAQVRSTVQTAVVTLARPECADADLVAACATVRQAEEMVRGLAQLREQRSRRVTDYRLAVSLLSQASELLSDRLAPIGEPAAEPQAALQRLSRRIAGDLSEKREAALNEVGTWQAELNAIRQQVTAFEQARRDAFSVRQHALRAILTDQLHRRADLLPPPLTFNSSDPDESERLLVQQTRDALGAARDRLISQLEAIAASARDQGRPEKLALLPSAHREAAAAGMVEVQQQLLALSGRASGAFATLIDAVATATPDELARQAGDVIALAAPAEGLFTRVQALTRSLQAVALTAEEAHASEVLQAIAGDGSAEFAAFEAEVHREMPGADAWALLRALAQKSRARIDIKVIRE